MAQGYFRCAFTSADGMECQSWFPSHEGTLCIIHRQVNSFKLAANGIHKNELISELTDEQKSLRELIAGKESIEACNILDAHIAKIEKIIEEQKNKYFSARAIRAEIIEGLSEEERQVRRRAKVELKPESERLSERKSKKLTSMSKDEAVQVMLKKYPSLGLDGVKKLMGVD